MPEDDNMSIILGRPFLNNAGAVINCSIGQHNMWHVFTCGLFIRMLFFHHCQNSNPKWNFHLHFLSRRYRFL
jgi:hypothetical protein